MLRDDSPAQTAIEVESLCKIFGHRPHRGLQLLKQGLDKDAIFAKTGLAVAVENASFSVKQGEIFVVMGLSGCGKSTLLRLVNRLIEPTAGRVRLFGRDVTAMTHSELVQIRRTDVSMVFQSFALLPHLSVLDNAAFGLEVAGVPKKERHVRAHAALESVGLEAVSRSRPSDLSGGMQQRVGLARALAADPKILLMDEAYSALDPLIRDSMQTDLLRLQREKQLTVMFVSHDIDEAIRLGDRIAIMNAGRIVQIGSPEKLVNNPADDYVASFFGKVPAAPDSSMKGGKS